MLNVGFVIILSSLRTSGHFLSSRASGINKRQALASYDSIWISSSRVETSSSRPTHSGSSQHFSDTPIHILLTFEDGSVSGVVIKVQDIITATFWQEYLHLLNKPTFYLCASSGKVICKHHAPTTRWQPFLLKASCQGVKIMYRAIFYTAQAKRASNHLVEPQGQKIGTVLQINH